ncbi:hypothetical protein AA105894_0912 [Asaia spathodeae NBRC 105894]|nr:hypothetical protein AA105894_0912 [Asaia spathodeae NBRC 105894]
MRGRIWKRRAPIREPGRVKKSYVPSLERQHGLHVSCGEDRPIARPLWGEREASPQRVSAYLLDR